MLNNNNDHNNNSCDFSEALISYLYSEIGAAESDKFKAHLAQCAHCEGELAGLGVMRSSLAEWKQEEFSPMSAPTIELGARTARPHERDAFELPENQPVFVTAQPSWLDTVRGFFTPKVALAAGAFTVLLICLGLTFAFLTSRNTGNENVIAANTKLENKIEKAPITVTVSAKETGDEVAKTAPPAQKYEGANTPKPSEKRTKAAPENVSQFKNNMAVNITRHQDAPKQIKPDTKTLTTDIYEETEDDSLRLADLFAEADTE
jgi:anti-sigma factor RsiW